MINAKEIYDKLLTYYGTPPWWSENPFEVMIGAILVQNTAWSNVQRVVAKLGKCLTPEQMEDVALDKLENLIRPCGFFKGKAACIKGVTQWYQGYGYSQQNVMSSPKEKIAKELLAIKGIGQETADVILLYAFYFPTFVIDAYTKRLAQRLALPVELETKTLKQYFESTLKEDVRLFGNYHWLILTHAIEHCKKKPLCDGCTLFTDCQYQKEV